ncbi:ABC transporter ATP-binding protein [Streptomyces mobaraensis NBRC 13819 = DSM 40847]|uniref:ABC transporter n=1 Tax=Streptomyces mobaraensis (strain ATCC 29032 / DSM 40847 / JCM 4168 / NBRC 13819 / NCIMB 11159 / IPCR 16-22) TaxID=1223523 RepID=M3C7H8_STRM1|nr:ABC transporter ATP-binding protein [Streptomyces mobaraensis]EME99886.1 ABC transporter [Streptomyces mobaraensis NBRC 13819 = DSM 40847]QTT72242.1 ABC transporter ATP-binding protein [Streptomyces mobaraensis NBRC 13819 = DSM 40847]
MSTHPAQPEHRPGHADRPPGDRPADEPAKDRAPTDERAPATGPVAEQASAAVDEAAAEDDDPKSLPAERRRRARRLLRGSLRPHRATLFAAMVSACLRQVALLAVPWCVQRALDDGIQKDDNRVLLLWSGATALAACVQFAGLYGWQYWASVTDARVGADLRSRLLGRLAGLDRAALAERGHGDLAMRATRDTDMVREWVHGLSVWVVLATTFAVVLPGLAALDPVLLLVTVGMLPFLTWVNLYFPRRFGAASDELSAAHGDRAEAVADLLQVGTGLRGTGGHRPLLDRHDTASATVTDKTVKAARIEADWAAVAPFVPRLAVAVGVGVGGLAVLDGRLTIGGLVAFTSWMATVTLATRVLVTRLLERGQADVAAARIDEALSLTSTVTDPAEPVALTPGGDLELSGVSAVRDGVTVLAPLDLTVRRGEFVAVQGATGSGKSTLLRLPARLDDPATGAVRYGGTDLRDAALDDVRRRIGYVAQRPLLLSGTVAENLRLGRDLSDEALRAACETACVHDQIAAMPEGYDTPLGESGTALSGGQIQRLALARGLLGDPEVLVLDDCTSALDTTTEALVLKRLRSWAEGRTVLFATHRTAVLEAADRVVTLADRGTTTPREAAAVPALSAAHPEADRG